MNIENIKTKVPRFTASLHTHVRSLFDAQIDAGELCDKIKELGGKGCAITDHGVLSSIEDYRPAFKEKELKLIPGVEMYVDGGPILGREHLIVLAKDDLGYKTLSKLVTESNRTLQKGMPVISTETLFKLTEGAEDHLVVTSACMQGVVCAVFRLNDDIESSISRLTTSLDKYMSPDDDRYKKAVSDVEKAEVARENAIIRRDDVKRTAEQKFVSREKQVEKLEKNGDPSAEEARRKLEYDKVAAKEAAEILVSAKEDTEKADQALREAKKILKDMSEKVEGHKKVEEEIEALKTQMKSFDELYKMAYNVALMYKKKFGKNFYAEVQYHKIPAEKICYQNLVKIAKELQIPLVATNDVHILTGSPEDRLRRRILRSMRFEKANEQHFEPENIGDSELYLKDNYELAKALSEILPDDAVEEAIRNIDAIFDMCNVEFKTSHHYPKYYVGGDADKILDEAVERGIKWRFPNGLDDVRKKRVEYELSIIKSMGYADYFLVVKDFLEYGRLLGYVPDDCLDAAPLDIDELKAFIRDNGWKNPGYTVGPGRGSGVGSLVAYVLGITHLDPIPFGLIFERFLNPARVSMPDFDSDFAFGVREKTIEYVKAKYGENAVCGIMTTNALAPKGAIDVAARFYGIEKTGETDSSTPGRRKYAALAAKIKKDIPDKPGFLFKDLVDKAGKPVTDETKDAGIPLFDHLLSLAADKETKEILKWAHVMEGSFTAYGMHAAGIVISDNNDVSDYIPLRWNSKSGMMSTQCDMVQTENNGLLKFDFLGLRTLNIFTDCLRLIEDNHGKIIMPLDIPLNESAVYKMLCQGKTKSVFQLESVGMTKALMQFKPTCMEDLIILISIYRPGSMQFLDNVVAVKNGTSEMTFLHDKLKPILSPTYGAIVYQEQVMQISQVCAGFSFAEADNVRRYMSKKKKDKLAHERDAFIYGDKERKISGCVANGIPEKTAETLFEQMEKFASYAFNKSHAAAYAHNAYVAAWLKYHYPKEFFAAALKWATPKKVPGFIYEAVSSGISISAPDVNLSLANFSVSKDGIVYGIDAVKNVRKGVSEALIEARKTRPFTGMADLLERCRIESRSLESLIDAGALDKFGDNRQALKVMAKELDEPIKALLEKRAIVESITALYPVMESLPDDAAVVNYQLERGLKAVITKKTKASSLETKLANAKTSVEKLEQDISFVKPHLIAENKSERMRREKEVLGAYVTDNPMNFYPSNAELNVKPVSELLDGDTRAYGIVSNLTVKQRKKDGAEMAFFTLEDKSGSIEVCVFAKAFAKFGKLIEEGNVYVFIGDVKEEITTIINEEGEEEEEAVLKMYVNDIARIEEQKMGIIMEVPSYAIFHLSFERNFREDYEDENGRVFLIFDRTLGEIRRAVYKVNEKVLSLPRTKETVY
jgi:DNA polymerase-3 subunit alpha